jgi:hypothetical protein
MFNVKHVEGYILIVCERGGRLNLYIQISAHTPFPGNRNEIQTATWINL